MARGLSPAARSCRSRPRMVANRGGMGEAPSGASRRVQPHRAGSPPHAQHVIKRQSSEASAFPSCHSQQYPLLLTPQILAEVLKRMGENRRDVIELAVHDAVIKKRQPRW